MGNFRKAKEVKGLHCVFCNHDMVIGTEEVPYYDSTKTFGIIKCEKCGAAYMFDKLENCDDDTVLERIKHIKHFTNSKKCPICEKDVVFDKDTYNTVECKCSDSKCIAGMIMHGPSTWYWEGEGLYKHFAKIEKRLRRQLEVYENTDWDEEADLSSDKMKCSVCGSKPTVVFNKSDESVLLAIICSNQSCRLHELDHSMTLAFHYGIPTTEIRQSMVYGMNLSEAMDDWDAKRFRAQ